jgi:hypothetical protein
MAVFSLFKETRYTLYLSTTWDLLATTLELLVQVFCDFSMTLAFFLPILSSLSVPAVDIRPAVSRYFYHSSKLETLPRQNESRSSERHWRSQCVDGKVYFLSVASKTGDFYFFKSNYARHIPLRSRLEKYAVRQRLFQVLRSRDMMSIVIWCPPVLRRGQMLPEYIRLWSRAGRHRSSDVLKHEQMEYPCPFAFSIWTVACQTCSSYPFGSPPHSSYGVVIQPLLIYITIATTCTVNKEYAE